MSTSPNPQHPSTMLKWGIPAILILLVVVAILLFTLLRGGGSLAVSPSIDGYWTHSSGISGYEFSSGGNVSSWGFGSCSGWYERAGSALSVELSGDNCRTGVQNWEIMELSEDSLLIRTQFGSVERYRR